MPDTEETFGIPDADQTPQAGPASAESSTVSTGPQSLSSVHNPAMKLDPTLDAAFELPRNPLAFSPAQNMPEVGYDALTNNRFGLNTSTGIGPNNYAMASAFAPSLSLQPTMDRERVKKLIDPTGEIFKFTTTGNHEVDAQVLRAKIARVHEKGRLDALSDMRLCLGLGGHGGPSAAPSSSRTPVQIPMGGNASIYPGMVSFPFPEIYSSASNTGGAINGSGRAGGHGNNDGCAEDMDDMSSTSLGSPSHSDMDMEDSDSEGEEIPVKKSSVRQVAMRGKTLNKGKSTKAAMRASRAKLKTYCFKAGARNPFGKRSKFVYASKSLDCPICGAEGRRDQRRELDKHIAQVHGPRVYFCTRKNCDNNLRHTDAKGRRVCGMARFDSNERHFFDVNHTKLYTPCVRSLARRVKESAHWRKIVEMRARVNKAILKDFPDYPKEHLYRTDFSLGELFCKWIVAPATRDFKRGVTAWLANTDENLTKRASWAWLEVAAAQGMTGEDFEFLRNLSKQHGPKLWKGLRREIDRLAVVGRGRGAYLEKPVQAAIDHISTLGEWEDDGKDEDEEWSDGDGESDEEVDSDDEN
jgi:hypothetical protein